MKRSNSLALIRERQLKRQYTVLNSTANADAPSTDASARDGTSATTHTTTTHIATVDTVASALHCSRKPFNLPFVKKLAATKNPFEFLTQCKEEYTQNMIQVSDQVYSKDDSEGSESDSDDLKMSDKEDTAEIFTKKESKKKIKKVNNFIKQDNDVLDLLLKKNTMIKVLNEAEEVVESGTVLTKAEESFSDVESSSSDDAEKENQVESLDKIGIKLKKVPIDWSLRREWIIMSTNSFDWCTRTSSKEECDALSGFTKGNTGFNGNHKEEFDKSLLYWVYPSTSRAPSHVALITKIIAKYEKSTREKLNPDWEYFKDSQQEWKIAFRSAYFMVKNQKSPYLYYVNSEFSVLFLYNTQNVLEAYLSSSTSGLRKALMEDEFITKSDELNSGSELKRTFIYQESDESTRRSMEEESKSNFQSMGNCSLLFNGVSQVHGLYDFLLKWSEPRTDRRALSFPHLYSSEPFLNATLKSSQVIRSTKIQHLSGEGYRMIIKGLLLPHSVLRLLDLFESKNGDFKVTSPVWDITKGLQEATSQPSYKYIEFVNRYYHAKE